MNYSFTDRYCTLTANLPETGITTIIGWITDAESTFLFIMDEHNNHTLIQREQLVGSIVVLEEQRELGAARILSEQEMGESGIKGN